MRKSIVKILIPDLANTGLENALKDPMTPTLAKYNVTARKPTNSANDSLTRSAA